MSRDCEYLFVWTNDHFYEEDREQIERAVTEASEWPGEQAIWLDDGRRLYWRCVKHGLNLPAIQFPTPPDQILEAADGDVFVDVYPRPRSASEDDLREAIGLAAALLSRPEPASEIEKQIMAGALNALQHNRSSIISGGVLDE